MSASPAAGDTASIPATNGVLTGFGLCVRLLLRRNWLRLLIWAVLLPLMIPVVYSSQQAAFPTQTARDSYSQVANTPAVAAMTGLPYSSGSLGGILVIKIWMTLAISLAFASIFLLTRNGRADEEAGRTELLRAQALGRYAYSLANYAVVGSLSVVTGLLIALFSLGEKLPTAGSFVMGGSVAGVGLVFVGIGALCGQLSSTSRGANSLGVGFLAVFYVIRAVADVRADGSRSSGLSWLSPIGWAQNMRAFGDNNWWPFLALLAFTVISCAVALRVETHRDLGMGLLAERPGPARASAFLTTHVGLVLRLQRTPLAAWIVGAVVAGLFFGGVATAMAGLLDPSTPWAKAFVGDSQNMLNSVLGIFGLFNALLAAAFAVQILTTARSQEAGGPLELELAGSVSRLRWFGGHVLVAAAGSAAMLLLGGWLTGASSGGVISGLTTAGASFAYWPAVLLMMGVFTFLYGFAPRHSVSIAWAIYGAFLILALFGRLFSLSEDAIRATPFGAVPRMPAEKFSLTPMLALTVVALVLGALGIWRFSTRDIESE
ncbi:ABC transporter permease [Arthrobacter cryoconiti]|uniref:ABC transporter permease n=1 Tax=Arthrobacter cryoconiti TaxID=748907 RepID=A0ABV8QY91_9MICC|nr:ABC transporter permease [Arthrobacter cryoconiti]MCC9068219.1 ABC transporter permease [Arthrobacter cryoconiti]